MDEGSDNGCTFEPVTLSLAKCGVIGEMQPGHSKGKKGKKSDLSRNDTHRERKI